MKDKDSRQPFPHQGFQNALQVFSIHGLVLTVSNNQPIWGLLTVICHLCSLGPGQTIVSLSPIRIVINSGDIERVNADVVHCHFNQIQASTNNPNTSGFITVGFNYVCDVWILVFANHSVANLGGTNCRLASGVSWSSEIECTALASISELGPHIAKCNRYGGPDK